MKKSISALLIISLLLPMISVMGLQVVAEEMETITFTDEYDESIFLLSDF